MENIDELADEMIGAVRDYLSRSLAGVVKRIESLETHAAKDARADIAAALEKAVAPIIATATSIQEAAEADRRLAAESAQKAAETTQQAVAQRISEALAAASAEQAAQQKEAVSILAQAQQQFTDALSQFKQQTEEPKADGAAAGIIRDITARFLADDEDGSANA